MRVLFKDGPGILHYGILWLIMHKGITQQLSEGLIGSACIRAVQLISLHVQQSSDSSFFEHRVCVLWNSSCTNYSICHTAPSKKVDLKLEIISSVWIEDCICQMLDDGWLDGHLLDIDWLRNSPGSFTDSYMCCKVQAMNSSIQLLENIKKSGFPLFLVAHDLNAPTVPTPM